MNVRQRLELAWLVRIAFPRCHSRFLHFLDVSLPSRDGKRVIGLTQTARHDAVLGADRLHLLDGSVGCRARARRAEQRMVEELDVRSVVVGLSHLIDRHHTRGAPAYKSNTSSRPGTGIQLGPGPRPREAALARIQTTAYTPARCPAGSTGTKAARRK